MTLQRFLIENHGPNVDAFKMALAEAIKFSRSNGIGQITLVVPAKGGFPDTIIGEFFGDRISKLLCKGGVVDLGHGISMNLEIPRNLSSHKNFGTLLATYLSEEDMSIIDALRTVQAVVYLPWHEEEGKKWLACWSPVIWGNSSWIIKPLTFTQDIEEALSRLTKVINLSTGLAHPSDKEFAKRMFLKLKNEGHQVEPEDVKFWAIKNGWQVRHAKELEKLATKYF
mgnify:FL=1|jgi:hypothetical protein